MIRGIKQHATSMLMLSDKKPPQPSSSLHFPQGERVPWRLEPETPLLKCSALRRTYCIRKFVINYMAGTPLSEIKMTLMFPSTWPVLVAPGTNIGGLKYQLSYHSKKVYICRADRFNPDACPCRSCTGTLSTAGNGLAEKRTSEWHRSGPPSQNICWLWKCDWNHPPGPHTRNNLCLGKRNACGGYQIYLSFQWVVQMTFASSNGIEGIDQKLNHAVKRCTVYCKCVDGKSGIFIGTFIMLKYYLLSLLLIIQLSIACLFTFICSAYIINTLCVHVRFSCTSVFTYTRLR